MPKPENIRRIVTGPKSANKSIRKSRSMVLIHSEYGAAYTDFVIASEAKQSMRRRESWIASSLTLLAMTAGAS
jgi:hypothetical protein